MRRFLREPMVHFLLGGALLFLLYGATARDAWQRPDRIVVSEGQIRTLAGSFQRTWTRPPTKAELADLIREFVNEEILYREGLALGLDRDDPVVRRRVRQKMDFLHRDLVDERAPKREELAAFLSAHPNAFAEPALLSFEQLYVKPSDGPALASQRADTLLASVRGGGAPDTLGDATLLPASMKDASESEIADVFGRGFADDLMQIPAGDWVGPVSSSLGLHLVRITNSVPERVPELREIRDRVEREWRAKQRAAANLGYLESLRSRYDIQIRMPSGDPVSARTAHSR